VVAHLVLMLLAAPQVADPACSGDAAECLEEPLHCADGEEACQLEHDNHWLTVSRSLERKPEHACWRGEKISVPRGHCVTESQ
jgi:hypothetical protein